MSFEKTFPTDAMPKKDRVLATLNHQPVDRVALHEQLSFNPGVIAMYTGKRIEGFDYTLDDICHVIRATMDTCFPPVAPQGTDRVVSADGFVLQHDNWTSWIVSRPFRDVDGARDHLKKTIARTVEAGQHFDPAAARQARRNSMRALQQKIGETVLIDYPVNTGLCTCYHMLGLELFTYVHADSPGLIAEFIERTTSNAVQYIRAAADAELSPVVLVADDFGTKHGPIFSPAFLREHFYPHLKRLVDAWHEHGILVLFHSDGNWKQAVPDLIDTCVEGFYCLEPACGMDIVELKKAWPQMVWAGGVDGVNLMEYGTPEQVRAEVRRHIIETDALNTGGMLVATSSEINPPVKPQNFRAMVEAAGELRNPDYRTCQ